MDEETDLETTELDIADAIIVQGAYMLHNVLEALKEKNGHKQEKALNKAISDARNWITSLGLDPDTLDPLQDVEETPNL